MLVQVVRKTTLPDGRQLRRGEVADLPDALAANLLRRGIVRERVERPALERKAEPLDIDPETPFTAPVLGPVLSYENEDNFIRNLVTVGYPGGPYVTVPVPGSPLPESVPLSVSVSDLPPILTLAEIKTYLRVDADYTDEDAELQLLEMSVRVATENALRRELDDTVGENVKAVMLLAIGRLYENREASSYDNWNLEAWLAQMLAGERDYPVY